MTFGCAICKDHFDNVVGAVATKCGHIFHNMCLEKWIERSTTRLATCPECKSNVTKKSLTRVFFNFSIDARGKGADESIDVLKEQLHTKDLEIKEKDKKIKELLISTSNAERDLQEKRQLYLDLQNKCTALNRKLRTVNSVEVKNQKLVQENKALQSELRHLNNVKTIVEGNCEDAKKILEDMQVHISDKEEKIAARKIATFCSAIKLKLSSLMDEKNQLQKEISKLKSNIEISAAKKIKFDYLSDKIERFNSSSQSSYMRLNPANKTPVVPDNNAAQSSGLAKFFDSSPSQSSYMRLNPANKTPVVPDNNAAQSSSLTKRFDSSSQSSYLRLNPAHKTPVVPDNNAAQSSSLTKHSSVGSDNSCFDCKIKAIPGNFECKHKKNHVLVSDGESEEISCPIELAPLLKLALVANRIYGKKDSSS